MPQRDLDVRLIRPASAPIPAEPDWMHLSIAAAVGIAVLACAALIGPAVFGVALWQQTLVADAVGAIERDSSCAGPMWQRIYDGRCLRVSTTARRKYIEGDGWNAVYHVEVSIPRLGPQDVAFQHAPTLYHRIALGRPVAVRLYAGKPFAIGTGTLVAAAGDGALIERRETWAQVRSIGISMMLFEVLVAAVFLVVKHVRRSAAPMGQDGLWN